MKTIQPFNTAEMRIRASERIHKMFRGVPFIYVKYRDNYAEGYAQYRDGIIACFTVWYRDLVGERTVQSDSQHERALALLGIDSVESENDYAL